MAVFIETSAKVLDPMQTVSLCDVCTRQLEYPVAMCAHWHWLNCKDFMPVRKKKKKKQRRQQLKEEEETKRKKRAETCRSRVQKKLC